ncbi:DUF6894 family protein [Aureimonas glaciei]|jgi:hypothetical protein|uniref:DUF6894 domain-containing protein n=1 Tax=Aureimonas glaciei TaxID=1776957 RepID=A0A917DA90_9HYPH|nr:hypothetical protein [Aureimonas glaciei]GGD17088.1 hypothetical protein GCM10011335_19920 [Aureimonas glaciei]
MSRYFLHIRDGDRFIEDFEGQDYSSLDAARDDAVVSARQMMAEKVRQGEALDGQVIEIWNEAGSCVATVVFRDQLVAHKPSS